MKANVINDIIVSFSVIIVLPTYYSYSYNFNIPQFTPANKYANEALLKNSIAINYPLLTIVNGIM